MVKALRKYHIFDWADVPPKIAQEFDFCADRPRSPQSIMSEALYPTVLSGSAGAYHKAHGAKAEKHTLDRSPVNIHSHTHTSGQFEVSNRPEFMVLDCVRKPKYQEQTNKVHTERAGF